MGAVAGRTSLSDREAQRDAQMEAQAALTTPRAVRAESRTRVAAAAARAHPEPGIPAARGSLWWFTSLVTVGEFNY